VQDLEIGLRPGAPARLPADNAGQTGWPKRHITEH
jgi:hypothetical protein